MQQIYRSNLRSEMEERRAFTVDLQKLLNDEDLKTAISELRSLVMNSPEVMINSLGLAMHQVSCDVIFNNKE